MGIPAYLVSSAETAPVFMDAPPNREHLRVPRRMDYVLLPARQTSIMSTQSSEEQVSSPSTSLPRYSRDGQEPLGRGHRVKKPNIRLSSTLSETDEPENIPKRPRPTPKAPRRSSASSAPEGDPPVRIWCHQCHQNRSDMATIACIPCGKSYCSGCLARRYGEKINDDQRADWVCPRCQNYCDCLKCIKCRREFGSSVPSAKTSSTGPRKVSFDETRVTRARAKRRSAESLGSSASAFQSYEQVAAVEAYSPHEQLIGAAVAADFAPEPTEATLIKVEAWSPHPNPERLSSDPYDALAFEADAHFSSDSTLLSTPTSSTALPTTPPFTTRPIVTLEESHFAPQRALRSLPTADTHPSYAVSPFELTSDFGSMLTYTYSPTIPKTVVDEYDVSGVVPINKSLSASDFSPTKTVLQHSALMLSDAGHGEQWELYSTLFGAQADPSAAPSDEQPDPVEPVPLGQADVDTLSRFLNADLFDDHS